ncbi:MAG: hypothetical protein HC867_05065 [Bacteroidia bacterium]|nr:hypothetical protein [Bacteroidia bacterium]
MLLVVSCFLPWVSIENLNITITGVDTSGTRYGKPALFHFLLTFFYLLFTLIQKIWAKRVNLLVTALNMGWAIRNLLVMPACEAGICPDKKAGLWLLMTASILMLVSALFPDT